MNPSFNLSQYMESHRQRVDEALERFLLPSGIWPQKLNEATRYSIFAGGKRLRPVLAMASSEAVGGKMENVLPTACALEMIHTYSLIHDDLPAMDDDDLRRGQATNHKVFGEALAILAGDSLLSEAFHLISSHAKNGNASATLEVITRVAKAIGPKGMVGGQVQDLESEKKKISPEDLEHLHRHKTGKLIQVSVESGALLGGATPEQLKLLSEFGAAIGLSFQIADDVLDIEGGKEIGKDIGSDIEKEKATYPSIMGIKKSKELAARLTEKALSSLKSLDQRADPLREIARYVVYRTN